MISHPAEEAKSLRVLILEDNTDDAELMKHELERAGYRLQAKQVKTEEAYLSSLSPDVDLILSDHGLPQFGAPAALDALKQHSLDIPFIVVSGAISEGLALEMVARGATDVLLKDRIGRLAPAVGQALEGRRLRKEKDQIHRSLKRSEALNRSVLRALEAHISNVQIMVLNRAGVVTAVNETWASSEGKEGGSLLLNTQVGANYLDVCRRAAKRGDGTAGQAVEGIASVLDGSEVFFAMEYPYQMVDEQRWFLMLVTPLEGEEGGVVISHENITQLQRSEMALRESEDRYRRLFAYSPEPVLVFADGKVIDFNQAAAELIGGTKQDDLTGRTFSTFVAPEDQEAFAQRAESMMEGGEHVQHAGLRFICDDGTLLAIESTASLITYRGKEAIQMVLRDVTERKKSEEALRKSESMYRLLAENATDIITRQAPDGTCLYVSPAVRTLLGYHQEAFAGCKLIDLVHPGDRKMVAKLTEAMVHGEVVQASYRLQRRDGQYTWVESTGRCLFDADMGHVRETVTVTRDINRRMHAEMALRQSEQRYRGLIENAADGILLSRNGGTFVEVNARACELTGYSRTALMSLNLESLFSWSDAPDGFSSWFDLDAEDPVRCELELRRCDGTTFPVEVSIKRIEKHFVQTIMHDMTIRKEYEEELIQAKEAAEDVSRMKSVFLANMSHELRKPLASVLGYTELLTGEVTEKGALHLDHLRKSSERLLETLHNVLQLTQLKGGSFTLQAEPLDVIAVTEGVCQRFRDEAEARGLSFRYIALAEGTPWVLMSRIALERILAQLLSNAIKFTPFGQVIVRVGVEEEKVELQVEDTGAGISKAFLPHVFDEFQQEASGGTGELEGSGMGLAVAKHLVELLGGGIVAESEKGKGSTFTVTLPVAMAASGDGCSQAGCDPQANPKA